MRPRLPANWCESQYTRLLRLFPQGYYGQFGESMRQTFRDLCRERQAGAGITLGFLLWAFGETLGEIIRKNLEDLMFKVIGSHPRMAALAGLCCLIPFVVANTIVSTRMEPFFSLIRPGLHTSAREYVLLAVVLLLMPMGALLAIRPLLRAKRFYLLNGATAAFLLVVFAAISFGLGSDIYACEIQQIPNCD